VKSSSGRWINHLTGWNDPNISNYTLENYRSAPVHGDILPNGFRRPTPWKFFAQEVQPFDHNYRFREGGYEYTTIGPWPCGGGISTPRTQSPATGIVSLPASIIALAETRMRNAVSNSDLDLGEALGELDESLAQLARLTTRLATGLVKLKKGDLRGALESLTGLTTSTAYTIIGVDGKRRRGGHRNQLAGYPDSLSDAYLLATYGIRPILSDIHALLSYVQKTGQKGWLFSATGEATIPRSPSTAVAGFNMNTVASGKAERVARCRCWFEVERPQMMALEALGLLNPLLLGWELLTLSFVVDWFIPIGAFLESITALTGTVFVAGLLDKIDHYDVTIEDNRGTLISGRRAKCHARMLTFQRTVYGFAPMPNPFVLLSGLGLSNVNRALSAAALITQLR